MPAAATSSPIDAAAARQLLNRLVLAPEAPWLHQEVARRMAERLSLVREAPQHWLDWWGGLGGGAQAVGAVLPKAQRQGVEPTPAWVEFSQRQLRGPWWAMLGRPTAERRAQLEADVAPGQTQLVWANMMLHLCPDPASVLARWHTAFES